jgi:cytochrome c biogenesis protein CcdA
LILSVFIHFFLAIVRKTQKTIRYANAVAGILLIGMGLLLITDKLSLLNFSR